MSVHYGTAQNIIFDCLGEIECVTEGVEPEHRLEDDLGLDSIEVVELVALVLKRAGLPAGAVMPANTHTVGELAHRGDPGARATESRGELMRTRTRIARVGALLLASAVLSAPAVSAAEHVIQLTDRPPYIQPSDLEIDVGDSVIWKNLGPDETHAVTDQALMDFSADIPVGEQWEHTFEKAGVFPFVCFRHHFMRGVITVRNADGSVESPPEFAYQEGFEEFAVPTREAVPRMLIVSHLDQSIWFTEGGGGFYGFEDLPPRNKLARLDEDGRIIEYATPTPGGDGSDVAVDSLVMSGDGTVWFTERLTNRIGRLSPDGAIVEYDIPTPDGDALGIDLDRQGNIWFAERFGNRIGRMTPAGEITEYELPEPDSEPRTVFVDSRDRVWYTARTANEIGYFEPSREEFVRLEIPTELARPTGIAETSDGAIYFVEMVGNKIGRVVGDQITEFPIPSKFSAPFKIVADESDTLWFTQVFGNSIGKLDPRTGRITEYKIPTPDSRPAGLSVDRRGRIWFTEQLGNKIGRFDPAVAQQAERRANKASDEPSSAEGEGARTGSFRVESFPLPEGAAGPGNDLVEDEDGWIWFNQIYANRIGALHPQTNDYREIELATPVSMPVAMARGQQGNLWVAEFRGNRLARVDPGEGRSEEFQIPIDGALPSGVAIDTRGMVWLTLLGDNSLARFDPATRAFERFPVPVPEGSPLMIAADAGGELWFTLTEERSNFLGAFDPRTGTFQLYPLPEAEASPIGLLLDDSFVWVAEAGAGKLARFDRDRELWKEYPIPAERSEPVKLAKDRRGRIWLTDGGGLAGPGGNRVIVFDPRTERFDLIPMEHEDAKPRGVLVASDGTVWFTQQNANLISRVRF